MLNISLLNKYSKSYDVQLRLHYIYLDHFYVFSIHQHFSKAFHSSDFEQIHEHFSRCDCGTKNFIPNAAVHFNNIVMYCVRPTTEWSQSETEHLADIHIHIKNRNTKPIHQDNISYEYGSSFSKIVYYVNCDETEKAHYTTTDLDKFKEVLTVNKLSHCSSINLYSHVTNIHVITTIINGVYEFIATKRLYNRLGKSIRNTFTPRIVNSINDEIINSMEERRDLWANQSQYFEASLKTNHTLMINRYRSGLPLRCSDVYYHLYDVDADKVLCGDGVNVKDVRWCWDGEQLIEVAQINASSIRKKTKSLFVSFNRHTILLQSYYHYQLVKSIDLNSYIMSADILQIQGVPGAGKTHHILTEFSKTAKTLIITMSREPCQDIIRRLKALNRFTDNVTVATFDSFMRNYHNKHKHVHYEEVWFDEASNTHGGDWMWLVYLTKCNKLITVGDRAQIPYVERTNAIVKFSIPRITDNQPKYLSVSHRCPKDIVHWMNVTRDDKNNRLYDFTVTTKNPLIHSVYAHIISGPTDIPRVDNAQYIAFTQDDVKTLKDHGFTNACSVHQYQGNQNAHVICVRFDPKHAKPLYKIKNYQLVALSRHTNRFDYYSVISDDPMYIEVQKISKYTDSVLTLTGGHELMPIPLVSAHKHIYLQPSSAQITYTFPKLVQSLNDKYSYGSFIPLNLYSEYAPPNVNESDYSECELIDDPCLMLQHIYNELYVDPNIGMIDTSYDHDLYTISDKHFHGDFACVPIAHPSLPSNFCPPKLNTSLRPKIPSTQSQCLKAFVERNGAVPLLQGDVDEISTAKILLDTVLSVCDKGLLALYTEEKIYPNGRSTAIWLSKQPESVRSNIENDPDMLLDKFLQRYSFMLKGNAKPDLDKNPASRYKSSQTIAFQDKLVNAIFCPLLTDFSDRLFAALNDNIVLFNRMSVDSYCASVDRVCPYDRFQKFQKFYEIDFSKFDKSQDLVALEFEILLMEKFGMLPEFLDYWRVMHTKTRIRSVENKFRADILYQRKSGDAGTWILNTVFQMAVVLHSLDITSLLNLGYAFATFSGDDSLVFVDEHYFSYNHIMHTCATLFNLEMKLLTYQTPYFCSKFFIPTPNGLLFVPDVIKTIVKLGRKDIVNLQHAKEYHVSFSDNNKQLLNTYNWPYIAHSINDRYSLDHTHIPVFRALCTLILDASQFYDLWDYSESDNRHYEILPSLDM